MNSSSPVNFKKRGAALIIVLAFLVLLSGIVLAYLSRTTSDRKLAHGTFSENRADLLARSALDVVVGDLKQEIVIGSTKSTFNGYTIYTPTSNANMLPKRSGNPTPSPSGAADPIPNLVRRSWFSDSNLSSQIRSRASAVNSTTDVPLNTRSIGIARWNKHYFVPRYDPSSTSVDSTPPSPYAAQFNPNPIVNTGFKSPDWVLVTRNGPTRFS